MAKKHKRWDGNERRQPAMILVAGDQADSNELLTRILGAAGYRTTVAETVDHALTRCAEHLPRAVVIDLSQRGIGSSLQLLDGIRSNDDPRVSNTRVVVVARSTANRNFTFQSGGDGYLLRPFHANDLTAMVAEVLALEPEMRAEHRRLMIEGVRPS